jgi:hypothetical protein
MHASRLESGGGIGQLVAIRQTETILLSRLQTFNNANVIAAALGIQSNHLLCRSQKMKVKRVQFRGPNQKAPTST